MTASAAGVVSSFSSSSFPTRSYRPLQCPSCKELLLNPVTLPCGFTLCQACLPPPQTIASQQQILCPFKACARSALHTHDQLSVDVTLQNLTTTLRTASLQSTTLANILSEDSENAKPHRQPDTLFYGSTHTDPAWDATLEGLFDPYEVVPTETSDNASHPYSSPAPPSVFYRNMPFIIDTIRSKIQQEIECQICFLIFDQPLTTYCGHTLCKSCLITSLDHKPNCPLCRRKLPLYVHYHNQPPNKALLRFIQYLASRPTAKESEDALPEEREIETTLSMTPLFINSLIFPRMPCYLLVFEPRYRKLLRNVLKTESKLFGMVLPPRPRKHRDLESSAWEPSMEYGTLLKILSCELLPDGRALVETIGLTRFQILTYSMMDGYYGATAVELIHDIPAEQEYALEKEALEAAAAAAAREEAEQTEAELPGVAESNDEQDEIDYLLGRHEKQSRDQERNRSSSSSSPQPVGSPSVSSQPSSSPTSSSIVAPAAYTIRHSLSDHLGLQDLHEQDLETLSRVQLMRILVAFVAHMQDRLGPLATQRLQREYGEMVEDDGQCFSFWVASILPVRNYEKYELLRVTSVRQRLLTVLGWIKEIETRRSMAVCAIS